VNNEGFRGAMRGYANEGESDRLAAFPALSGRWIFPL
jgi:hypothetical protein